MEIRFKSDDPEYSEDFADWKELADARPYARLNPESLSPEQRIFLISEFEAYEQVEKIRDGDEEKLVSSSPVQIQDPVARFAQANLSILRGEQGILELVTDEAKAFLSERFEGFVSAGKTYVTISARQPRVRLNPNPMTDEEYSIAGGNYFNWHRGDTLHGAYLRGALPALSREWHAVRIIDNVSRLQSDKSVDTLKLAIEIGESRQALLMKSVKASDTGSGGKAKRLSQKPQQAERNAFLQTEFAKLPDRWSDNQKLEKLETVLAGHPNCQGQASVWMPIKKRQLRKILLS